MTQHVYPVDQEELHNLTSPDCFCEPVARHFVYDPGCPDQWIWVHQRVVWDFERRYRWARVVNKHPWLHEMAYGS